LNIVIGEPHPKAQIHPKTFKQFLTICSGALCISEHNNPLQDLLIPSKKFLFSENKVVVRDGERDRKGNRCEQIVRKYFFLCPVAVPHLWYQPPPGIDAQSIPAMTTQEQQPPIAKKTRAQPRHFPIFFIGDLLSGLGQVYHVFPQFIRLKATA